MPKIIIADSMEAEVVQAIGQLGTVIYQPKDLAAALQDADALIVRSATKVTAELLQHASQLKLVARAGVGLDNVDAETCKAKNIRVLNTPGASTNAVAELAIACMLNLARKLPTAHMKMKNRVWAKKELTGSELLGKTLGLIGLGRIGQNVAQKALAFGMSVIAHDPYPPPAMKGVKLASLDEVIRQSDFISLHSLLTPETRHMINTASLARMKKGVFLMNLARGELIDEDALYGACKSGQVAGAALDVYSQEPYTGPLLELDNIYFTPHIGASTKEAQMRIGQELVEKLGQELKA